MKQCELVYDTLNKMGLSYTIVEHPPALTTEEADSYIEGLEGVRTKTLFLCNKKNTAYYLIVMDDAKRLDIKLLCTLVNDKGLRFCSTEKIEDKLSLYPGAISVLGLINNKDKDVQVFFDKEIMTEKIMTFHPNDNTKTIFISTIDLLKFLTEMSYGYGELEL